MASDATITLTREAYDALVARNEDLEDRVAALEADDGTRIPHAVALAIMRGKHPVAAFRAYRSLTLRELSKRTGIAASYLSEIERARKPGSATALSHIAAALSTTIDILVSETTEDGKSPD